MRVKFTKHKKPQSGIALDTLPWLFSKSKDKIERDLYFDSQIKHNSETEGILIKIIVYLKKIKLQWQWVWEDTK